MVKIFNYFSFRLIYITLLILNFTNTISSLSFEYPTVVTLNNGNIFVIHKTGVSICDPSFSLIINNVTVFESGNQITSPNSLSKVSISQFNEGYIVSIIINKIYIFSPEGRLEYISDVLTNYDVNIFISRDELFDGNQYYYLIGYIYQNSIYLEYYYYISTQKKNNLHSSARAKKDFYYSENYNIKNKGISCQMLYYKNKDLIVCADYVYTSSKSYLSLSYFSYNGNTKLMSYEYISNYYYWSEIMCIKSTYGEDRTKAFFCMYLSTGELNCLLYDVNASTDNLPYEKNYTFSTKEFYALKVYYFPDKNQYGLSYITQDGNIQAFIYDSTFKKYYHTIYKFSGCNNIYSHSLIYLKNYTNYYIITDAEIGCDGNYI